MPWAADAAVGMWFGRVRVKSNRFCTSAHCLFGGSLTSGFARRLDAPFLTQIDRVILAQAFSKVGQPKIGGQQPAEEQ